MNRTAWNFVLILLVTTPFGRVAGAQSADRAVFDLDADTPVVEIGRQSAGRAFMQLPTLSYVFDISVTCTADLEPVTVSLSIADTRKSLATKEISNAGNTSITMTIPEAQIGPIAVNGFCVTAGVAESIRIPAVLSAQASLLCANDEGGRMIYASRSLDVTLLCAAEEDYSPLSQ